MKVFVSSGIRGMEAYREAAVEAVEALGYRAVRAEDFGERYGEVQASGRSATHEEFEEARDHGTVAVFVQRDIAPDPARFGRVLDEDGEPDIFGFIGLYSEFETLR